MNTNKEFDIIIVGAGPAGSTAAYYLGKYSDKRVLLVDKKDFPRYKSCAGGLFMVDDWPREFENFQEIRANLSCCSSNEFDFYCDRDLYQSTRDVPLFDVVDRFEFDAKLLIKALQFPNVQFVKGYASQIEPRSENQKNQYTVMINGQAYLAEKVIGADGFKGVVNRFLGNGPASSRDFGMCLQYDVVCQKQGAPRTSVFLNWDKELGFSWIFPTTDGYTLGIGLIGQTQKPLKQILNEFKDYCAQANLIALNHTVKRFSGAPCPVTVTKTVCKDGILLCGDSLGVVRQLTGEGIYYAMKTGKLAASLLLENKQPLAKHYKKALKPILKEVVFMNKLPPVGLSKALLRTSVAALSLPLPFKWHLPIRKFIVDVFHRMTTLPANSVYQKEKKKK